MAPDSDQLDKDICKQMNSLVELLTTSGKPTLNPDIMKKFKKLCRTSDLYVDHAFKLLMSQLTEEHAEIRLSTFLMMEELFNRSHVFRELLITDLQTFLELTVGIGQDRPLPPPKLAAQMLKSQAYKSIQQWYEKFGEAYKKLSLGYHFLKTCKKVDFDSIQARRETERRQKEEVDRKIEENRKAKLEKVLHEFNDFKLDISMCVTEVENGVQLLLPHPEDFFISVTEPSATTSTLKTNQDSVSSTDAMSRITNSACIITSDDGAALSCDSTSTKDVVTLSSGRISMADETENSHCCKCSCDKKELDKSSEESHYSQHTETKKEKVICSVHYSKESVPEEDKTKCKQKESEKAEKVENNGHEAVCHRTSSDVNSADCNVLEGTRPTSNENDSLNDDDNAAVDIMGSDVDGDEEEEESDYSDGDFEDVSGNSGFRQEHGLFSHKFEITVKVGGASSKLEVTDDNRDIIQDVRERYRLMKSKYLPSVKNWIQSMYKWGAKQEDIKDAEDMKTKMEDAVKKCLELEIITSTDATGNGSEDSEDEFEEVPEKEGYEEDVPEHVRLEAAAQSAASTSKSKQRSKGKRKSAKVKDRLKKAVSNHWKLSERLLAEDEKDPTTWKSNVKKLVQKSVASSTISFADAEWEKAITAQPEASTIKSQSAACNSVSWKKSSQGAIPSQSCNSDSRKKALLEKAPVVPFGLDLEHWENPDKIKAPIKEDKHEGTSRFWVPSIDRDEESGTSEEIAALTRRTTIYTGQFEPVKWTCRAPLPNGRLCERMDRVKCPFHGKVIGRDKLGLPTDPVDVERLMREKYHNEDESDQEEQDPELQTETEPTTDLDAQTSKGKGQGKGKDKGKKKAKKRKHPNLTDIKQTKDTCRNRLESKIFKRSTMKRVNTALDAAHMKMISDKFGHQFNYSLK